MSEDGGDDDKPHDASQKRLEEARNRGQIPSSTDLYAAGALAGLLVAAVIFGPNAISKTGLAAQGLLDGAERLAPRLMAAPSSALTGIGISLLWPLLPFFVLPGLLVLLMAVLQKSTVFATDRITPKWSKISPLSIAAQKFGREGLFQFAKSALKLAVISALLVVYTLRKGEEIMTSLHMSPAQSTVTMMHLMLEFLVLALLFTFLVGAVDYGWQILQHLMRNRMSRKELMDEMKDNEGDPHVKMQRRMRGQEIATNQMLADVAKADVVVVNPTHYAVALKWKRGDKSAPICLAKGVDEIAAKIRERAAQHGVPMHSDPPTARAIYATVGVGKPIRPDQYRAVAASIRFAEAMRKKAKAWKT
jgi:flagellar biosynthetic protein FlhB